MMEGDLSMTAHVNEIADQCFYSLRKIKSIRPLLFTDAIVTLITRLICSWMDYCNTVFVFLPNSMIDRLQSVLHAAARVITDGRKYDHITLTLRDELHWLPVMQRITFRLCLTVYKALHGMTPYIAELCRSVAAKHYRSRLHSATYGDLVVPQNHLEFGKRAFAVAGPTTWNNLLLSVWLAPSITTFKQHLKCIYSVLTMVRRNNND